MTESIVIPIPPANKEAAQKLLEKYDGKKRGAVRKAIHASFEGIAKKPAWLDELD
jgi:hypothetical protein